MGYLVKSSKGWPWMHQEEEKIGDLKAKPAQKKTLPASANGFSLNEGGTTRLSLSRTGGFLPNSWRWVISTQLHFLTWSDFVEEQKRTQER
ncbi:unnamed protein product [Prunus armeniaca]